LADDKKNLGDAKPDCEGLTAETLVYLKKSSTKQFLFPAVLKWGGVFHAFD
jgi:hypothetical protein